MDEHERPTRFFDLSDIAQSIGEETDDGAPDEAEERDQAERAGEAIDDGEPDLYQGKASK